MLTLSPELSIFDTTPLDLDKKTPENPLTAPLPGTACLRLSTPEDMLEALRLKRDLESPQDGSDPIDCVMTLHSVLPEDRDYSTPGDTRIMLFTPDGDRQTVRDTMQASLQALSGEGGLFAGQTVTDFQEWYTASVCRKGGVVIDRKGAQPADPALLGTLRALLTTGQEQPATGPQPASSTDGPQVVEMELEPVSEPRKLRVIASLAQFWNIPC